MVGSENALFIHFFRKIFIFVGLHNFARIHLCILTVLRHVFEKIPPHFSIAQNQGQNRYPFLKIFDFQKNTQFVTRILDALTVLDLLFAIPPHLVGSENAFFISDFLIVSYFCRLAQTEDNKVVHFAYKITACRKKERHDHRS